MTTATTTPKTGRETLTAEARDQYQALKVWHNDPAATYANRPNTDTLDAMTTSNQSGGSKMSTTTKMKATPKSVQFYRNGKAMGATYNSMAHLALQSTKGVGANGSKLNSAGLRALLDDHGIDEPQASTWFVTLVNGVTIGAVNDGDSVPEELTVVTGRTRQANGPKPVYAIELEGARTNWVTLDGVRVEKFRSRKAAAAFIDAV